MAVFDTALKPLLKNEGGFVNDPDDPGGATNRGVTMATLKQWRGHEVSIVDVHNLSEEEAGEIYRANYWDALRLDDMAHQALAESVFDFGVNAGPKQACLCLQRAVNWVREATVLVEDGVIGPATLREVDATPQRILELRFAIERLGCYVDICRRRRTSRKFLYAWAKRTLENVR